jgi:hypothetical protein
MNGVYVEDFSEEAYERAIKRQKEVPFEIYVGYIKQENRLFVGITDQEATFEYIKNTYAEDEDDLRILDFRLKGDISAIAKETTIFEKTFCGMVMNGPILYGFLTTLTTKIQAMVNGNVPLKEQLFFKEWHVNTEVKQLY